MAAPLSERCELLSDKWLETASAYISAAVEQARDQLGSDTFVVVERFTNTPPHLGFPDAKGEVTYTISANGGNAQRGASPDADRTVVADYQAALYISDLVGATVPGEMQRIGRELAHMFGSDALQVSGKEMPPEVAKIFMGLHDYLARRTLENPDLAHRASRQGLTDKLAEYQQNGYTIIERAITDEMADQLREALLAEILPHDHLQSHGLLHRGRIFELMVQHPLLRTVVESAAGRGAILASLSGLHKDAGPGVVPMHTDYNLIPSPYPELGLGGVAVWALEDWTEEAGPTWVIPGSHRRRRYPTAADTRDGGVPIVMPKGSVVFFGDGIWHWQGDRTLTGARVTLHANYVRNFIRPLDSLNLEPHILDRNGPAFSELTGKDDAFEKSGVYGHDMQRWRYTEELLGIHNGEAPLGEHS